MRPVFVGNFEFDTRHSELEKLFEKYGRVDRIDMKSGYAFVYFEDERDAEDAIRKLDNFPYGYDKRRLTVEWAKGQRGKPRGDEKSVTNMKPTKTLFVINFDPAITKERDVEEHFAPYGKVLNVRIRRNFSFVQFATQEDATKALEATQGSKILDRVVSIEYAKDESRSRSPVYRNRPSPDYRPRSPDYDRRRTPAAYERRKSPAAYEKSRSPAAYEKRRSPAAYERRRSPAACERRRSPDHGRRSSDYGRQRSPAHDRHRSRSPVPRR